MGTSNFNIAVGAWLRSTLGLDAANVVSVTQETEEGGSCETCWYEYIVVNILYLDSKGREQAYSYYGEMSTLVNELLENNE